MQPLVGGHHVGHLGDAGSAPSGPEINEHHFPLHLSQVDLATVGRREGDAQRLAHAFLGLLDPFSHGPNLGGHVVRLQDLGDEFLGFFTTAQLGDFHVGTIDLSAARELLLQIVQALFKVDEHGFHPLGLEFAGFGHGLLHLGTQGGGCCLFFCLQRVGSERLQLSGFVLVPQTHGSLQQFPVQPTRFAGFRMILEAFEKFAGLVGGDAGTGGLLLAESLHLVGGWLAPLPFRGRTWGFTFSLHQGPRLFSIIGQQTRRGLHHRCVTLGGRVCRGLRSMDSAEGQGRSHHPDCQSVHGRQT